MGVTPSTRTQIRPRVTDSRLSAPAAPAGPTDPVEAAGFDPSEHNVKDVREYVEANPDEAELVLAAEAGGKDRASLVAWLNDFLDSRADSTDDEG